MKRGYKPIYCNEKIIKLVYLSGKNPLATRIILKALQDWLVKNHLSMEVDTFDILSRTKYLYTYFIAYEPVDVFKTELIIDEKNETLFFRPESGRLIDPFQESDWIVNDCD